MNNNNGFYGQNGTQDTQNAQGGQYYYRPPQQPQDPSGSSAQLFGVLALVSIFLCIGLPIIFGAIAMHNAKRSFLELGVESSQAKAGRICGLIGLIIGIVSLLGTLMIFIIEFSLLLSIFAGLA